MKPSYATKSVFPVVIDDSKRQFAGLKRSDTKYAYDLCLLIKWSEISSIHVDLCASVNEYTTSCLIFTLYHALLALFNQTFLSMRYFFSDDNLASHFLLPLACNPLSCG